MKYKYFMLASDDLAAQLKRYRLKRLWTYQQLSNATGLPLSTLYGIINKKRRANELTKEMLGKKLPGLFNGMHRSA